VGGGCQIKLKLYQIKIKTPDINCFYFPFSALKIIYPALFMKNQKCNSKKIDYSGLAVIARYPNLGYFSPKVHFFIA
jgi:hypothetical protein